MGWYQNPYSILESVKHLIGTLLFKDLEGLLGASWFLQSLAKGLLITYLITLVKNRKTEILLVVTFYFIGWYLCDCGIHLLWSLNREIAIVSSIYMGMILNRYEHVVGVRWFLLVFVFLLLGTCFVRIDLVCDNIGFCGFFPLYTFIGVVFVRTIVDYLMKRFSKMYSLFVWLGQHTIPILMLHFVGFHILSSIFVCLGFGSLDSLSSPTVLSGIDNVVWSPLYVFFGIMTSCFFIKVKNIFIRNK